MVRVGFLDRYRSVKTSLLFGFKLTWRVSIVLSAELPRCANIGCSFYCRNLEDSWCLGKRAKGIQCAFNHDRSIFFIQYTFQILFPKIILPHNGRLLIVVLCNVRGMQANPVSLTSLWVYGRTKLSDYIHDAIIHGYPPLESNSVQKWPSL
jgi:hypothetical protein